ncbi:MAG: IS110 family transposase [Planctomycetota bacterium]|nr:IS110 family transposase [Planctomycetota bacterium]
MSKTLLVGIDVGSLDNAVCLMDDSGNQLGKVFPIPNSYSGAHQLEDRLQQIAQEHSFDSIKIATEATSLYDFHIADYLSSSQTLAPFNTRVYRFNAKLTRGFKKAYPDRDHTDPADAYIIADRLRFGRLPAPYSSQQPYLPLRRLTRYRLHLVETIAREKSLFLINLFLKFSHYSKVKPFSNTFGATSLALIDEFFSAEEIVARPLEELVDFIVQHGRNRFPNPQEIAETVKYVARESYRIRPELAHSVNLILASIMTSIRALTEALKSIEAAILKEFAAFPNTLQSVKGIGPVYAAGIFAEIGDIALFPTESQLARFAGLWWKKHSSGKFCAEETRLVKSANQYLRYYLIEAANSLRTHNETYRVYYQKKYKEVTKHQHKRALVLTARKLVRLVFALLSKKQLYDTDLVTVSAQR